MSEIKEKNIGATDAAVDVNERDAVAVVAAYREKQAEQENGPGAEQVRERPWMGRPGGLPSFQDELARVGAELEAEEKRRLRREGMDSLYLGLLCGLGVVSLVGAWISGHWEPVALGLGICLSGGAAVLLYRATVVLRK